MNKEIALQNLSDKLPKKQLCSSCYIKHYKKEIKNKEEMKQKQTKGPAY